MTEVATTASQRQVLKHALGLDRAAESYRNRYVAGEGHFNFADLEKLVELGCMERHDFSVNDPSCRYSYTVTSLGMEQVQ